MKIGTLDFEKGYCGNAEVDKIYLGNTVVYSGDTPAPTIKALKFTSLNGISTLGITNNGGNAPNLQISVDGVNWNTWGYAVRSIPAGASLYVRGNNPTGFSSSTIKNSVFTMTGSIACEGNVMHLLNYTQDLTAIPTGYCFCRLFQSCTSLRQAPELPATSLQQACYAGMFSGCTNLNSVIILPAPTLASFCYQNTFNGCTSLNNITMLATDVSANDCLKNWVAGVSPSGRFTKKSGVTLPSGSDGIPNGWTVIQV